MFDAITLEAYGILGVDGQGTLPIMEGDEHKYMIEQIAELLSKNGWETVIESEGCNIKAKYPDGKKMDIEVETCKGFNKEQIIKNIVKNLRWADIVVMVAPNAKAKKDIQRLTEKVGTQF